VTLTLHLLLLTGHNTLRRHLHIIGLCNDPMYRKCGTEEETSVYILCECQALASLRHAFLGFLLFGPGGYKGTRHGGHLELCQGNRAPIAMYRIWGTEGPSLRPRCIGPEKARTQYYSIRFTSFCRSQWTRGLRHRSAAARLLRSWVGIPPGAWMFVCCECCMLSGRSLCDELITRPEESYRLWCVVVCGLETSRMRGP